MSRSAPVVFMGTRSFLGTGSLHGVSDVGAQKCETPAGALAPAGVSNCFSSPRYGATASGTGTTTTIRDRGLGRLQPVWWAAYMWIARYYETGRRRNGKISHDRGSAGMVVVAARRRPP